MRNTLARSQSRIKTGNLAKYQLKRKLSN